MFSQFWVFYGSGYGLGRDLGLPWGPRGAEQLCQPALGGRGGGRPKLANPGFGNIKSGSHKHLHGPLKGSFGPAMDPLGGKVASLQHFCDHLQIVVIAMDFLKGIFE